MTTPTTRGFDLSDEPRTFICLDCKVRHAASYGFGFKHGIGGWFGRCLRCLQPKPQQVACPCDDSPERRAIERREIAQELADACAARLAIVKELDR